MRPLLLLAACGLLAACQTSPDTSVTTSVTVPPGASGTDAPGAATSPTRPDASPDTPSSGTPANEPADGGIYTRLDLARCETLRTFPETGDRALRCPGYRGVALYVTEGDGRIDVDAGVPNDVWTTPGPFNSLGETVEWRLRDGRPAAAIVRYRIEGSPARSDLAVLSVGRPGAPGCLVGYVPARARPSQNAAARALADAPVLRCAGAETAARLPARYRGTFDVSRAACAQAGTMDRVTLSPDSMRFYYGYATVETVASRAGGVDVTATLTQTEGQEEVRPQPAAYRIEPGPDGGIRLDNTATDVPVAVLVRCPRR